MHVTLVFDGCLGMTYGITGFVDPLPPNPVIPGDASVDVQGEKRLFLVNY